MCEKINELGTVFVRVFWKVIFFILRKESSFYIFPFYLFCILFFPVENLIKLNRPKSTTIFCSTKSWCYIQSEKKFIFLWFREWGQSTQYDAQSSYKVWREFESHQYWYQCTEYRLLQLDHGVREIHLRPRTGIIYV
jgi:hypothetical protein